MSDTLIAAIISAIATIFAALIAKQGGQREKNKDGSLSSTESRRKIFLVGTFGVVVFIVISAILLSVNGGFDWANKDQGYHVVNIPGAATEAIAFRTKNLTRKDFDRINAGEKEAYSSTLIGVLQHGKKVQLLEEHDLTYEIVAFINGEEKVGFIAKEFGGKPTLRRLK